MAVQIAELDKAARSKKMPQFKSGQTVRIYRKIKEGEKERTQIFEGLIIKTHKMNTIAANVTVRKIIKGIGVEQIFPIFSPNVQKIELVREAKVRRSKLYFMRELRGKAARLKERFFTEEELKAHSVTDEEIEEAVQKQKEEEEAQAAKEAGESLEDPAEETATEAENAEEPKTEEEK